jgi:hypothetical protein
VLLSHFNWVNLQTSETTRLLAFIRMIFEDFSVKEELLEMIALKGRTLGHDIFNYFYSFVMKSNVPLHKLVSIITDG